jgi:hypothetical protein
VGCDGDDVVTCNATGSGFERRSCGAESECQDNSFGCSCVNGGCELRVCTPGTARCVGESIQECADDGLAYLTPVDCDAGEICVSGVCE